MWTDTRDCEPLLDGTYMVQMASGLVQPLGYTLEGGWNTFIDSEGTLHKSTAIKSVSVARWFDVPKPEPVPQEWREEWLAS